MLTMCSARCGLRVKEYLIKHTFETCRQWTNRCSHTLSAVFMHMSIIYVFILKPQQKPHDYTVNICSAAAATKTHVFNTSFEGSNIPS